MKSVFTAFFLLLSALPLQASVPEKSSGFVNDFAGILDDNAKSRLNGIAAQTEIQTTAEISVVTVTSLDGRSVEEYANVLFNQWGIGKKGKNNGVLVLVAPNERKVRIEVGYGLEPILPDGLAGEIIREQFVPAFKSGDYSGGVVKGVEKISLIIVKNEPAKKRVVAMINGKKYEDAPWQLILALTAFLALFVTIGFFFAGVGLGSKTFFLVLWGCFFGGIPMAMVVGGHLGRLPILILAPAAIFMFMFGCQKGMKNPLAFKSGKRGRMGSGWVWGGGSGGGFGGGGGGGGGGSSGGGGASGSW